MARKKKIEEPVEEPVAEPSTDHIWHFAPTGSYCTRCFVEPSSFAGSQLCPGKEWCEN